MLRFWREFCREKRPYYYLSGTKTGKEPKLKPKKINELLTHISTNNITDLKEQIYAGVKLVYDKICIPRKTTNRNSKPGWEIRLETQVSKEGKLKRTRLNFILKVS